MPAVVALSGVGGDGMLQCPEGNGFVVAAVHEHAPGRPARRHRERWLLGSVGEGAEPVSHIAGDRVLGPEEMHAEDPVQRLEQLGHVAEGIAEGKGPAVDLLDLSGAIPPRRHQRGAEADEEGQLCLVTGSSGGKFWNKLQPGGEVGNGLSIGGSLQCPFTGKQPELQRSVRHRRRREVVGDDFRVELRLGPFGELLGDHSMVGGARAAQQRVVGDVLDEGVLEGVRDGVDPRLALQQT